MKIYVIHNPQDKLRAENIKTQFASQEGNWQYEIVEAVMNYDAPRIGTMRSFKKCIEKAKKENLDRICILEDDILFLCEYSIDLFFNRAKDDEVQNGILLGGIYEGEIDKNSEHLKQNHYSYWERVIGKLSGLHACIIPNSLYDVLLGAEEPYHLDYWISEIAKIPVYVSRPMWIIQGNFPSANNNNMEELNRNLGLKYKLAGQ